MPRPQNNRTVNRPPLYIEFKPIGVPGISLTKVNLTLDEYEAIRLADFKGFTHDEASDQMNISRSTFSRLIVTARRKFADFMIHGKILSIEGGNIHFSNNIIRCTDCGYMFKTKIGDPLLNCPDCDSNNLLNLAGGFGHGRCCVDNKQNKGGNHAKKRPNRT